MPHFHIPLQSGSDTILKLMHRHYDAQLFRKKIEQIKALIPEAFIGIDVIVGTRGETDCYFNESKQFIESLPFSQLHVFSYSERPNTQALKIQPAVSPFVRNDRSKQLLELSEMKWKAFYERYIGRTATVLFEHAKKGLFMHGFTENYIRTETPYQKSLCNTIHCVKMTGWNVDKTALTAELID
jgi:threonylcarbamoyladenosine tRNA methylthiotransferase MtaB